MRKLFKWIVFLTLFIFLLMATNVYAETPTLEQIANAFNNCSTVEEYANSGSIWKATINGDKLNISVTTNNTTTNLEYTLENSILSANFSEDDVFTGLAATIVLVDSIGQLHGYSDGELFTTLNSNEIANYTVENEGFEIKETSNGGYETKIDISKKIPLIDASNVYIEVSDLQDLKDYISGDGSANLSKGNIWFNKSGYDGNNTVLVAEKDELTDNTYKSILSIIEVMFNSSEVTEYFETNYSNISVGNKEFTGFKIEINPTKTEFEEGLIPSESEYEFVRITIDKNLVNSTINDTDDTNNTNNINENIENKVDNTIASEKLPQTGLNIILPIISVVAIILIAIVLYKKYMRYKNIK